MDWFSIILLIGMGIVLLLIEILFVPGTTFVGLIGGIMCVIGIIYTYTSHGPAAGTLVLVLTTGIGVTAMVYSFKAGIWKRFSNKNAIRSKVNEAQFVALQVGDTGITTSSLRPVGKAEFGNRTYEVHTLGNYIEEDQSIKIISISNQKIIVEPITT